jgi:hypothetical protein
MFRRSTPYQCGLVHVSIRDTFVFISHEFALTKGVVQHDDINASRHAQSVMRPEYSNDHKGSDPSGITSSTVRKETDFV